MAELHTRWYDDCNWLFPGRLIEVVGMSWKNKSARAALGITIGLAFLLPATASLAAPREFRAQRLIFSDKELRIARPVDEPRGFGATSKREKQSIHFLRYERPLEFGGRHLKLKIKAPHKKKSLLYLQIKF